MNKDMIPVSTTPPLPTEFTTEGIPNNLDILKPDLNVLEHDFDVPESPKK